MLTGQQGTQKPGLETLPDVLINNIMLFLTARENGLLAAASKNFNLRSDDNRLWFALWERRFQDSAYDEKTYYKKLFAQDHGAKKEFLALDTKPRKNVLASSPEAKEEGEFFTFFDKQPFFSNSPLFFTVIKNSSTHGDEINLFLEFWYNDFIYLLRIFFERDRDCYRFKAQYIDEAAAALYTDHHLYRVTTTFKLEPDLMQKIAAVLHTKIREPLKEWIEKFISKTLKPEPLYALSIKGCFEQIAQQEPMTCCCLVM